MNKTEYIQASIHLPEILFPNEITSEPTKIPVLSKKACDIFNSILAKTDSNKQLELASSLDHSIKKINDALKEVHATEKNAGISKFASITFTGILAVAVVASVVATVTAAIFLMPVVLPAVIGIGAGGGAVGLSLIGLIVAFNSVHSSFTDVSNARKELNVLMKQASLNHEKLKSYFIDNFDKLDQEIETTLATKTIELNELKPKIEQEEKIIKDLTAELKSLEDAQANLGVINFQQHNIEIKASILDIKDAMTTAETRLRLLKFKKYLNENDCYNFKVAKNELKSLHEFYVKAK